MAGRPRKVISMQKGHINKSVRETRVEGEQRIKADADKMTAPDWLTPRAEEEFYRVIAEARKIDFLDNLDLSVLAVYADNYARYADAAEHLNTEGLVNVTDSGYATPSPYMSVLNQSAKNIFTCSSKLGLAITDRLKLIVPQKQEKPKNKYEKFLDKEA